MLTLERIEDDLFRTVVVSAEAGGLFGGQVAAQETLFRPASARVSSLAD